MIAWMRSAQGMVCMAGTVVFGFVPGQSPVTMARRHIGRGYTLTMDIADFYDSVTRTQIRDGLLKIATMDMMLGASSLDVLLSMGRAETVASAVCHDGAPRQGLPCSPFAANIAAHELDLLILAGLPPGIVYTRYADDMVFSGDDRAALLAVRDRIVPDAIAAMGWRINPRKTRMQDARYGRRIICGIAVGDSDLRAPRRVRRKARAIGCSANRRDHRRARGLRAWIAQVARG